MKIKILTILIALSISNVFAQTDSLNIKNDIDSLKKNISILQNKIDMVQSENTKILQENKTIRNSQQSLKNKYSKLNKEFIAYKNQYEIKIDSLKNIIKNNSNYIEKTADELGIKIKKTEQKTDESISSLSDKLSKNTLYWIIAILIIAILLIVVFIILRKQIFKQKTDLNSDIEKTRKVLQEESIKLDNKLIKLLETQLKILNNSNVNAQKDEPDHSLALKVADEIVRIEKNIAKLESNTKGLKPLIKGIERIKDNFKANGYEMVRLLGVEYNDGMNIDVINFIDDENIPEGKRIITKIIKPQVNYNGVLIQRAQVDVSQN
jgi:type II secretory pathway pseudopilin PulG